MECNNSDMFRTLLNVVSFSVFPIAPESRTGVLTAKSET